IQLHQYNDKYIVKIELGMFEQLYKIHVQEVENLDKLENQIIHNLLPNAFQRFLAMRSDWKEIQKSLK
ncbi:MAG: hypothetical protein EBS34_06365, partial [Flavobacteriales bacterium]|nr:hypothetical protein [Flavobacteriales bacterium]